jgi:hypothetical protein
VQAVLADERQELVGVKPAQQHDDALLGRVQAR